MRIYIYDEDGLFTGEVGIADESPLEEGVFLIPAMATDQVPLTPKDGFNVIFDGKKWGYVKLPKVKPEQPNEYSVWDESLWLWVDNLDLAKSLKLSDLNTKFYEKSLRPRVEVVSLGYFVDGGRADLDNFKNGRDLQYQFIKDANNVKHSATASDYDEVIRAIQENGASLIGWLWDKKDEINAIAVTDTVTEAEAIIAIEAVVI